MTQRLSETVTRTPDGYMNKDFRMTLEYHIPRLKSSLQASIIQIEPALAFQYEGDFYGLLISVGIPRQYHWAVLRSNDMISPTDYRRDMVEIIQPPFKDIDDLQSIWSANNNLSYG